MWTQKINVLRSFSLARKGANACTSEARSSQDIMKVIPLSEAKARLSKYAKQCQKEPVIVTVNGVPSFQMVPLDEEDDLIDELIKHNPKFRKMLADRLKGNSSPPRKHSSG